jgi:hypothetical protein
VLTYAGSPAKKGLEIAVEAWLAARRPGWRLEVTGIDPDTGRAYLRRHGVPEPDDVAWLGVLDPVAHRRRCQQADVYLAASRYEDYGLGQLEALCDGAVLVTVPSPGPYAALDLAKRLDQRLVADAIDTGSLTRALGVALSYSEHDRQGYRDRASDLVEPYLGDTFIARLEREVLPSLLGPTWARNVDAERLDPGGEPRAPADGGLRPSSG